MKWSAISANAIIFDKPFFLQSFSKTLVKFKIQTPVYVSPNLKCLLKSVMMIPKKVPSASLVKMISWTFVEAQITHIEVKFSPIWQIFLPLYHQLSKRASYFISLQRSIKQFLPVKCLLLFLISTQPRNISGWYCVFWRLGDIKNKKYLRIKKMHPFLVIFVDWNWKISIKLDMSRGNRSKCAKWAWPPFLPQN